MKANLYVLVGLPGSGKSYYAKNTLADAVTVSSDEIRGCLFGDEAIQGDVKQVFAYMDDATRRCLEDGRNVVYDATSLTSKLRSEIISKYSKIANIIGVFLNTSVEECLDRNAKRGRVVSSCVIEKMSRILEPPVLTEGFNEVVIVN